MTVRVTFVGSGDAFGVGGRFQTCILVDAPGIRFAIDFGASSLIALNKLEIDHTSIDTIVVTHIHGDHVGGIPYMLMDGMLAAKRTKPLTIIGPRDTETRMLEVNEVLFPGMHVMEPKFELSYVETDLLESHSVDDLTITRYPAIHTVGTNPTSVRIEVADKVISYTGDGEWNEHIPTLAADADLFITECYYHQKPIRFHMNYPELKEHWGEISAKRTVFTHLGREMYAVRDDVPEECAFDGMVIEI
ncbi:MAG: MBL fold metallo-hydrolase [Rhodospirillaceae bacterium]|nr:MBL fold metallo-hydrolase [Rhodospirillaceae bacterium]HAA92797.1 MBL fold metallo-hydrolase [Rhodospirillaceae bacterium]|tara:strand:- start:274 stop:1014 length:741 start_codon:yes stop_codon:yes gene_type:complete